MARKLKIIYYREKCIGAAMCAAKDPAHFIMQDDNKAHLAGSKQEGGREVLTITCDNAAAERMIEAASQCPVSVIRITDLETGEDVVTSEINEKEDIRMIPARYDDAKEFVLDPKGYFLVRLDRDKKLIEVGFCGKRNTVETKIIGKNPREIYMTILREKIIDRPDHAAYLGKELHKAHLALELDLPYVQDDDLDISSLQSTPRKRKEGNETEKIRQKK